MTNRQVDLQTAYLLHSRPYRNSSVIANFFTASQGRIDAVVRGVRGKKAVQPLQLFTPLLINWSGKGSLVTVNHWETQGRYHALLGKRLFCGFYVNELLTRLLVANDAHTALFTAYAQLLGQLVDTDNAQAQLRYFECQLLAELGYGIELQHEAKSEAAIIPEQWYQWQAECGFSRLPSNSAHEHKAFYGENLLALASQSLTNAEQLADAKRLMRRAMRQLLGDKPLKSRELFL